MHFAICSSKLDRHTWIQESFSSETKTTNVIDIRNGGNTFLRLHVIIVEQ